MDTITCREEGCAREVYGHKLCSMHYQRHWKAGTLPERVSWNYADGTRRSCLHLGCDRPIASRGLCSLHYQRSRAGKKPSRGFRESKWVNADGTRKTCVLDGCEREILSSGLCSPHYHAANKIGTPREKKPPKYCPVPGCGRLMANRKEICAKCNQTCWRYGLPRDKWMEMNSPENRHCSNMSCRSKDQLHIDHDHSCICQNSFTAKDRVSCGECVRGWLCRSCNLGLGFFQDDPAMLAGILNYLQNYKNPTP